MKKLTPKEYQAIHDALMSSDIMHMEEEEVKVIKSAFAKFGINLE